MEKQAFPLRPHHGLCLRFFQGKGYSDNFVANMGIIQQTLESNPMIRLAPEMDNICGSCPNNQSGICTAQEKVLRYDAGVLRLCGLEPGQILPYQDFARKITQVILQPGRREEICSDCQWSGLCQWKQEEP